MSLEAALALVTDATDILLNLKSDLAMVASEEGVSATLDSLGTTEMLTHSIYEALLRKSESGAGQDDEESQT